MQMKLRSAVLLQLLGLFLCGLSARARELQQTADAVGSTTTSPFASDVNPQAASGTTRPAAPAVNLFTAVPGAAAATASVDAVNLPKEVEVVTTQTASELDQQEGSNQTI